MNELEKRIDRAERLSTRWIEATASESEERELRDLLTQTDSKDLSDRLHIEQIMFEGFTALAGETCPPPRTIPAARQSVLRRRIGWAVAAAVIVCAIVTAGALQWHREPYCYIDGKPIYDAETAMAATLSTTECLQQLSLLDRPIRMVEELISETPLNNEQK